MYYLVNMDHKGMAAWLTRSDCEGLTKRCIYSGMDGTDGDTLWSGCEEGGNVTSVCEEDEGTDCEDGDSDTDW
jgi:hypothetical protein